MEELFVETKVESLEGNKVKVTVTVDAADIDGRIKKTYKDFARKYNFPGFRKGKAPRPVIDNALGAEAVVGTVTEELPVSTKNSSSWGCRCKGKVSPVERWMDSGSCRASTKACMWDSPRSVAGPKKGKPAIIGSKISSLGTYFTRKGAIMQPKVMRNDKKEELPWKRYALP